MLCYVCSHGAAGNWRIALNTSPDFVLSGHRGYELDVEDIRLASTLFGPMIDAQGQGQFEPCLADPTGRSVATIARSAEQK